MVFEIENEQSMQAAISEFCRFLATQNVSPESIFNSRLVATELLGNVFRHTNDKKAVFHGLLKDGVIELTVTSASAYTPPKTSRLPELFSEHGRGLYLVDSVCVERLVTAEGGILVRIKRM